MAVTSIAVSGLLWSTSSQINAVLYDETLCEGNYTVIASRIQRVRIVHSLAVDQCADGKSEVTFLHRDGKASHLLCHDCGFKQASSIVQLDRKSFAGTNVQNYWGTA